MRFTPTWAECDVPQITATAAEIEAEPMFYNATHDFIDFDQPTPLTSKFMLACIDSGFSPNFNNWSLDTRSTMLMPGWFPAIPGWHHDDVDRDATGQPIYHDSGWLVPSRRMFTVIVEAEGRPTGSRTEFVNAKVGVTYPPAPGRTVYAQWDHELEEKAALGALPVSQLESGKLYEFGQSDFHRATPATNFGWRWFARLTINPGPRPAGPKIRRQVQVYTPTKEQGW